MTLVANPRRAFDPFAPHLVDDGELEPVQDPAESIRTLLASPGRVKDDGDPAASIRRLLKGPLDPPKAAASKPAAGRTRGKGTTSKPSAKSRTTTRKPAAASKPAARASKKKES